MQIGNPQSFNRYSYVGNDPVNLVDPTGLVTCFGYFVFYLTVDAETGEILSSTYGGFIPVFCYDDGPFGGGGGGGSSGGGGGGGPASRSDEVDQNILNICLENLYGVQAANISVPTRTQTGSTRLGSASTIFDSAATRTLTAAAGDRYYNSQYGSELDVNFAVTSARSNSSVTGGNGSRTLNINISTRDFQRASSPLEATLIGLGTALAVAGMKSAGGNPRTKSALADCYRDQPRQVQRP